MIVEVEALLREAVEEMLADCVGEDPKTDVFYHLTTTIRLEQEIATDEDGEAHHVIIDSVPVWLLNLHVIREGRPIRVNGFLPYHYCSDGDVAPMREMVRGLWERYQFSHMMFDSSATDLSIEQTLRQIAEEAERGT